MNWMDAVKKGSTFPSWPDFFEALSTTVTRARVEWKTEESRDNYKRFFCPNKNNPKIECSWQLYASSRSGQVVVKRCGEHRAECTGTRGRKRGPKWEHVKNSSPAKRAKVMMRADKVLAFYFLLFFFLNNGFDN